MAQECSPATELAQARHPASSHFRVVESDRQPEASDGTGPVLHFVPGTSPSIQLEMDSYPLGESAGR